MSRLQENKLIDWTWFCLQWNYLKSLQKYLSSSRCSLVECPGVLPGFSTLTVCVFSNCLLLILLTSSRTCDHSRVHSWWWCWWWHWCNSDCWQWFQTSITMIVMMCGCIMMKCIILHQIMMMQLWINSPIVSFIIICIIKIQLKLYKMGRNLV